MQLCRLLLAVMVAATVVAMVEEAGMDRDSQAVMADTVAALRRAALADMAAQDRGMVRRARAVAIPVDRRAMEARLVATQVLALSAAAATAAALADTATRAVAEGLADTLVAVLAALVGL